MATYKVLQDIEAEDKLLGPLTLKQFIFAAITLVLGFLEFRLLIASGPFLVRLPFVLAIFPFMLVFGFLAAPIGRDQPNEVWLLARLRFLLKPHNRIWNQDGISQLVTITAPKKVEHIYTNNLSQTEVKSRLQALANTVDSRGWAIKNINTNLFAEPGYLSNTTDSDRLIDPASLPQDVPSAVVTASDDMLDTQNNPIAQHLDQLVQASTKAHKQQAISQMQNDPAKPVTPQNYWFLNQPAAPKSPVPSDYATFGSQQVVAPGTTDINPAADATAEEKALAERLAAEQTRARSHVSDHMKVIQPLHDHDGNLIPPKPPAVDTALIATPPPVPPADDRRQETKNPAILGLAHNDDLNVATIARQAKRISEDDDEVVISLH